MTRALTLLIASALTLCALAVTDDAEALIRPQRGMAGVELGISGTAVHSRKGAPDGIVRRPEGGGVQYVRWVYLHPRVIVGLIGEVEKDLTVVTLATTASSERTLSGIGVGSSERAVRRAYPSARCRAYRGVRTCSLGEPGGRQTSFTIKRERVVEVRMGDVF